VFCEGFQHHLKFCLNHISCIKMAESSIRETEERHRGPSQVRRVGGG
jgi:hypothetical protein